MFLQNKTMTSLNQVADESSNELITVDSVAKNLAESFLMKIQN